MAKLKAINKTKDTIIASNVRLANNIITRIIGLLLDSSLSEDFGLLIKPAKQIHAYGMRFTFDAIFIDKNDKVIHLIEKMKPWSSPSKLIWNSKKVLEISAGVIAKTNTEIGDIIIFEDN